MSGHAAPEISVIIPAYGRPEVLSRAVRSVFQQDIEPGRFELIVVDSSADDRCRAALTALEPEATCRFTFLHKDAEGPGPSRNLGARHSQSEILAFLDSDCRASRGWLRAVLAAFHPGIGLLQGQTAPDPEDRPGVLTHTIVVDRENHIYESCNIVYRRQAFFAAGGFQPDLHPHSSKPMGGEDVELAWTVKRAGWKSLYVPEALVYHEVTPLPLSHWFCGKRLLIWPRIAGRFPEVRRFFYARFFYDRAQALLCLAVLGLSSAFLQPILVLLCLPYIWHRGSERTATLSGARRIVRVAVYGIKDLVSLGILVAGSIRYRSLLL